MRAAGSGPERVRVRGAGAQQSPPLKAPAGGGRLRVGVPPAAASSKNPRPPLLEERLSSGEKGAEPWRCSGEAEPEPCLRSLPLKMT